MKYRYFSRFSYKQKDTAVDTIVSTAVSVMAEKEGFEPSRRRYRPTGVRSQTLQPLGYFSVYSVGFIIIIFFNGFVKSIEKVL